MSTKSVPLPVRQSPLLLAALLGLALNFSSVRAAAQTVAVGTCDPTVPSYDEIQDAVDGVPVGGVVEVCPGAWAQQVRITRSLSLVGVQSGNSALPVIVPPLGGLVQNATGLNVGGFMSNNRIAAQILVTPGVTVDISRLALDGTNGVPNCLPNPANALKPVGVYFDRSSGSVTSVAAKNHLNTCVGPQGDSVLIQNNTTPTRTVNVTNSSFRNFGWMAVEASGFPAFGKVNVTIDSNTVVGPGITDGNGLWMSYAATGSVTNNSVADALRTGEASGFWGIIGQCVTGVTVSNNTISNTDTGIALDNPFFCPAGFGLGSNIVGYNVVSVSRTEGIRACGSNNLFQYNTLNDNAVAAIDLTQGCQAKNNMIVSNTVNGGCTGLLVGNDASLNTIAPNDVSNAKYVALTGDKCTGGFSPTVPTTTKTLPGPPQL